VSNTKTREHTQPFRHKEPTSLDCLAFFLLETVLNFLTKKLRKGGFSFLFKKITKNKTKKKNFAPKKKKKKKKKKKQKKNNASLLFEDKPQLLEVVLN